MISWIVATHDADILYRNLIASMVDMADDELVIIPHAPSIAAAYSEGQTRAAKPIRCYIHHDMQVLNLPRLRSDLHAHVTSTVGMVGLIGSRTRAYPWWDGQQLGSVFDQRIGALNAGPGGECALLDGVLLATVHDVAWDESIPGWHGYDHDSCEQMLDRGLPNFCLTGGHEMARHNNHGSSDPDQITGFHAALTAVQQKWGPRDGIG